MKHTRRLSRVRRQAENALKTFTKAQNRLLKANDQIVAHIDDIDSTISSLSAARNAMALHHQSNTKVIGQLAKITNGGE